MNFTQTIFLTALGCAFPFLMTVLGSAAVFFFRRQMKPVWKQVFLGFAAGVMLAASVWSLLTPAIAAAEDSGLPGWLPAAGGLAAGVLFLLLSDIAVSRLAGRRLAGCRGEKPVSGPHNGSSRRSFLLWLAMTVHNIPEGMAVGLSFALISGIQDGGAVSSESITDSAAFCTAAALSLGIGIQNLPEGAAVALPLLQNGIPRHRAFWRGCLSGLVEPVSGILAALLFRGITSVMPWLLSFAAGAMLYVVAEELIPAANHPDSCHKDDTADHATPDDCEDGASFVGTLSIMSGFLLMMVLDVALG
ncbi:MAG: ZIP family metal transporter [Clostridia bacterium]|nr:ZIP family metal transporter [Clostridia bacterium]